MDGLYFIYVSWILWAWFTFMYRKSATRFHAAFIILVCLNTISLDVMVFSYRISYTSLLLFIFSFLLFFHLTPNVKHTIIVFSLSVAYAGGLFWEMARPVWFHFSSEWMIAIPAALLLVLVASDILTRMVLFGISTFLGEVIFTLYIHQLGFNEPVGEPAFLDMYSIVVFLLLSTELFMHFVDTIEKELNRRMKRKVGMKQ